MKPLNNKHWEGVEVASYREQLQALTEKTSKSP
jgi:hypothetical protein